MAMSARVVRLQYEGMTDSMTQVSWDGGWATSGVENKGVILKWSWRVLEASDTPNPGGRFRPVA
jgi:hypothetical protein